MLLHPSRFFIRSSAVGGAEDADLEHADGRFPELPRRGAGGVAYVHGGLVHDMVRAFEACPDVDPAGEPAPAASRPPWRRQCRTSRG